MPHFCRMFMQYVMRDIIMITPEFVRNLLKGKKSSSVSLYFKSNGEEF